MSNTEHDSKELTVCKNQLAHFKAMAKRLREQREQLRSNFALAESKVLVLTDEMEHLKAENDRMMEQLKESNDGRTRQADNLIEKCHRIARLKTENAKLRELVRDMWPHVRHRSRMCGECELPCDTSDECLLYEPMRQRMRDLGIEVD